MMNARRNETRRKIQLGGLVIKAGMDEYPAAVILGALSLASKALTGEKSAATFARFQAAGDALFSSDDSGSNRPKTQPDIEV